MIPSLLSTTATTTILLLNTLFISSVNSIPMKYSITKPAKECLYLPVKKDEFVTASLFITDGTDLKARMIIQGPITSLKISSSAEVLAAGLRYEKSGQKPVALHIDTVVDFETIYDNVEEVVDDDFLSEDDDGYQDDVDDALFEEYYYEDDDDEYEFMEDDSMDEEELMEIRKEKAKRDSMSEQQKMREKEDRRQAKRMKFEEVKRKKEENSRRKEARKMEKNRRKMIQKKKRDSIPRKKGLSQLRAGEPLEKTYNIREEGWYRYCIAPLNQWIEVEMEIRKSSEVGPPNKKTGHLQSYDHHYMRLNEKKMLKHMSNKDEESNGVKPEDLQMTSKQISKLNKLLYEIKGKQSNERRRLSVHAAVNEHSHSRMVLSSLFETIFYIAVSGFQVYTIRKWFSGNLLRY